jgi:hypothetical protein
MTDAAICRKNKWKVGTRLVGREGGAGWYRVTTIEITAIGNQLVLAKIIREMGRSCPICFDRDRHESLWSLHCRIRPPGGRMARNVNRPFTFCLTSTGECKNILPDGDEFRFGRYFCASTRSHRLKGWFPAIRAPLSAKGLA